jgi:DNA polymerase-3 subunit delta'
MELQQTAMPPYPWQQDIWANFCETLKSGKLPHALLFSGNVGLGIDALTYAAARYLLCLDPLDDVSCGRCRSCTLLNSGMHPDLLVISLEEGASQIKVDQIRRCVEFDAKTAHFDVHKLIVVIGADAMNVNAANALLKNLEEPLGKTRFLLSCARVDALLPTIRSRCQKISVPVPDANMALSWLEGEGYKKSAELMHWLDRFGGAPLGVKDALENGMSDNLSKFVKALGEIVQNRTGAAVLAKTWKSYDVDALFSLQFWVLEALIKGQISSRALASDLQVLQDLTEQVDVKHSYLLREKLLRRLSQWRSQANPNAALVVEEMALDWQVLLKAA